MKKDTKIFLSVFTVYFIVLLLVTSGIFRAYFEQDEWAGFSSIIHLMTLPWWQVFIPFELHFTPIGTIIWSTMYRLFHINAHYYYLVEFVIHTAVATLVFILTRRMTKNSVIGMLSGVLFLLNSRAHQAFTHLAVFNSTDTCMFFIMLFYVYLTSIEGKILEVKQSIVLFIIFLAAVSTREEGFIIIPTCIAYIISFDRKKINKENIKSLTILLGLFIMVIIGRYFVQTLHTDPVPQKYQISRSRSFYNLLTIPIKLIDQNMLYYAHIAEFFLARYEKLYPGMIKNFFTDNAPLMDVGFFYIFGIFSSVTALWFWLIKPRNIGPFLVFFSVWIYSHAFILSFVAYPIFVLEPRYLYFSAFPVFCFVSMMLYTTYTKESLQPMLKSIVKPVVIAVFCLMLIVSYQEIRSIVNAEIIRGEAKTKVLKSLHAVHPKLSDNTIFYVQCKTTCYRNGELGIPNENVLPFSSGPGMIMLITYVSGQEKVWGAFFSNSFLFDIYAEDYKQIGSKSFGYFVSKNKLEDTLKKHKLSKDIVVALEYDEQQYSFKDISEDFRKTIDDATNL